MNKVLIEIQCPATGKKYDFWIAKKMLVDDVIDNLTMLIQNSENNTSLFTDAKGLVLFKAPKFILDRKSTLKDVGIRSGDTLILI